VAFSGPLVLKANLRLTVPGSASIDISDQVTGIKIAGQANTLDIPPTGTTSKSKRKSSVDWTAQVDYMANDQASTDLARIFFQALANDPDGFLGISGTMRAGAASSVNPRWFGTIVTVGLGLGGTQEALATDSQTFPFTAAPSFLFTS
jgi:hypothetical protein